MSSCVGLIYVQSLAIWIKITASGLSYELGVNGEKKVHGNWYIINKKWKSKTRVTSYELQVQINSCEFKSTSYEFKCTS